MRRRNSKILREDRRIFGLETEYAVLYQPDSPEDPNLPPFSLIETILFKSMLEDRKAARSLGIKGGYFLENGGLAHLEIYLHDQSDTPILELATPECSNPHDLLRYQRAYDALLSTTSDRSWKALQSQGYTGRIVFGKNNLDSRGVGYGCHENYLAWHKPNWFEKFLAIFATPFLILLSIPWLMLVIILLSIFLVAIACFLLACLVANILKIFMPNQIQSFTTRIKNLFNMIPRSSLGFFRHANIVVTNFCLYPGIAGFTLLLKFIAYRPYFRNLTSLLITRQIFTGAGWLNPKEGRFELSQRASLTTSLAKIIMVGRHKTIFDLKGFLYRPLTLFKNHRKLTLCLGDSNLSDIPNLLKFGTTALILDMIEAGVDFSDLFLANPVKAFREVSIGGAWKVLNLKGKSKKSSIDIQREYLRRAKIFHAENFPEDKNRQNLLKLWEETLDQIADNPKDLTSRLDWAAKKTLLDRAILPQTNWKTFSHWAKLFHITRRDTLWKATSFEEFQQFQSPIKRYFLKKKVLFPEFDPGLFTQMRELYFQCLKIDLRFHEISCDPGYQRQMEAEHLIQRCTEEKDVRNALSEPPPDTRARLRSYYIKLNSSLSRKLVQASWEKVVITHSAKFISLSDPFFSRIPTD